MNVFALYEVHKYEGGHMVALFESRRSALKSGLSLRRKRVEQALEDYREFGCDSAEYCYRNVWKDVKICVEELTVNK